MATVGHGSLPTGSGAVGVLRTAEAWDALIVTTSNEAQARAYHRQLQWRKRSALLEGFGEVLAIADPAGQRIGSGGSTAYCLWKYLARAARRSGSPLGCWGDVAALLRRLRVLIVHGGGESRRLPAYAHCGKSFVPLPGEPGGGCAAALLDRILAILWSFPANPKDGGQVVVASGDVLLECDLSAMTPPGPGATALGCRVSPSVASGHGVFVPGRDKCVRLFLQKPTIARQRRYGALDGRGQAILDVGVMSFAVRAAVAMLRAAGCGAKAAFPVTGRETSSATRCVDLYREICCAMGSDTTYAQYVENARAAGSELPPAELKHIYRHLHPLRFDVEVLPRCRFIHCGTTSELIAAGGEISTFPAGPGRAAACTILNTVAGKGGRVVGRGWVEGCRVNAPLHLGGRNLVAGVDIEGPLNLPKNCCLDIVPGSGRGGRPVWFVRCYGTADDFKTPVGSGAMFCGREFSRWLEEAGLNATDVWAKSVPADRRDLWNARIFPAVRSHQEYRHWLWMFGAGRPMPRQRRMLQAAALFSMEEMSRRANLGAFWDRRERLEAAGAAGRISRLFGTGSDFSSDDLRRTLERIEDRTAFVADVLAEAFGQLARKSGTGEANFTFSRIMHSLGTAVEGLAGGGKMGAISPGLRRRLSPNVARWAQSAGLPLRDDIGAGPWGEKARALAFEEMNRAIVGHYAAACLERRWAVKPGQVVRGRSPARMDLGGGWTDTPPYCLERGGAVVNAAIDLEGRGPIHCRLRVISEPVVRLYSIDAGKRLEIREISELMDYRDPADDFGLAKGALTIAGFAQCANLRRSLERLGGGVELATRADVPKGSGLGTSSILGATILATIHRAMGRRLTFTELCHLVLGLEQEVTTGGGWQDQIGGCRGGVKFITARAGMAVDPAIRILPGGLLDSGGNGGAVLLYYTGITRRAKNIVEQVVGGYLNRDRAVLSALSQSRVVAEGAAQALSCNDGDGLGYYLDEAWRLNNRLCRASSNGVVEDLFATIRPHLHGVKLLGAGGGGFALMVCKSRRDAKVVRRKLNTGRGRPSRFCEFTINTAGLKISTGRAVSGGDDY